MLRKVIQDLNVSGELASQDVVPVDDLTFVEHFRGELADVGVHPVLDVQDEVWVLVVD